YQSLNQNSLRGKPVQRKRTKQPFNGCLILFIYSLSTGFDKEPFFIINLSFKEKNGSAKFNKELLNRYTLKI
ncbi:hypothetical protein, partial [Lactobacillus helveticus]|uniref:hypothetical protein n=1 Tax=Lactobacillus helveticus TaxID=1587 RepID=UPI001C64502F